jgi:hypothetical protein
MHCDRRSCCRLFGRLTPFFSVLQSRSRGRWRRHSVASGQGQGEDCSGQERYCPPVCFRAHLLGLLSFSRRRYRTWSRGSAQAHTQDVRALPLANGLCCGCCLGARVSCGCWIVALRLVDIESFMIVFTCTCTRQTKHTKQGCTWREQVTSQFSDQCQRDDEAAVFAVGIGREAHGRRVAAADKTVS